MNKWEREVFLPKLSKKVMSDKEFMKVSRAYDRKTHDVTRQAFNGIHTTVDTMQKVQHLVENVNLLVSLKVKGSSHLKDKWTKKGYLEELSTGPMTDKRFDDIMENIASSNTRKFREEYDVQRNVANSIWGEADGEAVI
jgi:hypothetical protein